MSAAQSASPNFADASVNMLPEPAAPAIVFVVMIESEPEPGVEYGRRGIYDILKTDARANTVAGEASRRHYRAWYEPMQVQS